MQHICLSMLHGSAELPAPLTELSPWVDWVGEPEEDLFTRLAARDGRRVLKTHTPLDGVVLDPGATYIVVTRDPLDMAVSLYHQGDNLDRERIAELTGSPVVTTHRRPPLREWLATWIRTESDHSESMDSLSGVVHHAADAWARRGRSNIVIVRYERLIADLEGHMRWLADHLDIRVPPDRWPHLVKGASFASMRAAAAGRAPDPGGVLKEPARFFRRGAPGAGREVLDEAEIAAYERRARDLVMAEDADDPDGVLRLLNLE